MEEAQCLYRFGRIVSSFNGVQQLQHLSPLRMPPQVVMATDSFVFDVVGYLCSRNSGEYHTLFQTTISISCQRFFSGDDHHLLPTYLAHQPHVHPITLYNITQHIMPQLRRFFLLNPFDYPRLVLNNPFGCPLFLRQRPRQFRFYIEIVLNMDDFDNMDDNDFDNMDDDDGDNIDEDDEVVGMIPASNEAIESLKTYKLPDCCPICMEKLQHGEGDNNDNDEEEVEFTAMPCGHGFHHGCILQWLETSHVCPICRYPLPTSNNKN